MLGFLHFLSRFLNPSRLFIIFGLKRSRQCQDFSTNLNVFWQISTILMRLNNLYKNLDASKSQLKSLDFKNLDLEKKNFWSWHDGIIPTLKKVDVNTKDNLDLDLDWSRLSRQPGLKISYYIIYKRLCPRKKNPQKKEQQKLWNWTPNLLNKCGLADGGGGGRAGQPMQGMGIPT